MEFAIDHSPEKRFSALPALGTIADKIVVDKRNIRRLIMARLYRGRLRPDVVDSDDRDSGLRNKNSSQARILGKSEPIARSS